LNQSSFDYPYHFHPELELTLILQGSGKRFVGDSIEDFKAGDLVLLGKNLPHCWLDYGKNPEEVKAIVIQFSDDCFGKDFFRLPEMQNTRRLLERSSRGIFFPPTDNDISNKIISITSLSSVNKILSFVGILNDLAGMKPARHRVLSKIDYALLSETSRFTRINTVYDFVYQNFKEEIRVGELAELVHMNVSAFCHYFKKSTGKTLSEFVNEIRIGYACKLLIEKDLTVSEVCFESGYNGLSNFNKVFKAITQHSPLNYRKEFTQN
jgi:AraC-like DNA-binding protein